MSEERLHVVFGAGQVGHALAARLAGLDLPVRVVSRHRPAGLADEVDWQAADASDPEAATEAARGASVMYRCLNAPYTDWPRSFPPPQRGVLAAAERTGALLVSFENLYGYGPTGDSPMTEDLPLAARTVKGRTRAAMTRVSQEPCSGCRLAITSLRVRRPGGHGVAGCAHGQKAG